MLQTSLSLPYPDLPIISLTLEGYKIFFITGTGEVFVRRIAPSIAKSFAQTMKKQAGH